jgi:small subunit ribosomal protein S2
VHKRLNRLKELDAVDFDDTTKGYTKKELLIQRRERDKLDKTLGGIRNMAKTPSAIWVIDSKREHLAVNEAKKLGIPVIGILDTNADPDELAYPIPGNDDAIRSVALLTRIIADAAAEGLIQRHQGGTTEQQAEPLAEWERELLQASEQEQAAAGQQDAAAPQTEDAAAAPQTEDTATAPQTEDAAAQASQGQADTAVPGDTIEQNDADAEGQADLESQGSDDVVAEHHPESQADVEAREEASSTEAEKQPRGDQ